LLSVAGQGVSPDYTRKVGRMSCKSCQSQNQRNLNGEIAIHFPGLKGLDKPIMWVFPRLVVCLDCGFTEFAIPKTELRQLVERDETEA
jgi:Zn ribbon nucleic-acid-binding protein